MEPKHSLLVLEGQEPGRRIELGGTPLVLGRRTAADLVLPEILVSALHCRVQVEPGRAELRVTDLKSTNGTFVDGLRITGKAYLAPGGTLTVGKHVFRHDLLMPGSAQLELVEDERVFHEEVPAPKQPHAEVEEHSFDFHLDFPAPEPAQPEVVEDQHVLRQDFVATEPAEPEVREDAEQEWTAAAWLPLLMHEHPLRTDWCYRPATPPHGAGFAVLPLARGRIGLLLIDVSGPPDQVAGHAAGVLGELHAVRELSGPAALFTQLNERWRMVDHDGLFFSAWSAVYDPGTRHLSHSCAGQHAALLLTPEGEMQRLDVSNPPLGLLPDAVFAEEDVMVSRGSRLYLFNRGSFDIVNHDGHHWVLDDFQAMLSTLPPAAAGAPERVFAEVRRLAKSPVLGDDFLLIQADFVD